MSDQMLAWICLYVLVGVVVAEVVDFAVRYIRRHGVRSRRVLDYTVIDYFRIVVAWPLFVVRSMLLTFSSVK